VMAEGAYLAQKFVRIGLMPDGGSTWFLARALGLPRALELTLFGDDLPAARALEWGLTQRVVPRAELDATAMGVAERLAAGPPLALAAIKRDVRGAAHEALDEALEREKRGQLALLRTNDVTEGVGAWIERRAPRFSGR
jgi:2-(1,2-epoxy-1,2-dihydrophenyl)acetyl-CoA isomerase